ncbi:MAG: hypothetical protein LBF22_10600 [Deltaproteobacteria bacterium]|jgi:hypothetical protein|nr:hypothetical protein [Deltaproteobacteria bacterium]
MTHQFLKSTDLNEFYLEVVDGIEVISFYNLLKQTLENYLTKEAVSILSEPSKNLKLNCVEWYTNCQGEVKLYTDLQGTDKTQADIKLSQIAGDFATVALQLLSINTETMKVAGRLISQLENDLNGTLKKRPGSTIVYFVGGNPVITAWGVVSSLAKNQNIIKDTIPPDIQVNDIVQKKALDHPPLTLPIPSRPIVMRESSRFLYFLKTIGTALLTLLLLLLLLFFIFPDIFNLVKGLPYDEIITNNREELLLQDELNRLRDEYFQDLRACRLPEKSLDPLPHFGSTDDFVDENAFLTLEEDETMPLQGEAPPPPPPPPPKPDEFEIPSDPKDLSNIEGCWKMTTNLISPYTKDPVTVKLCFDSSGKGTKHLTEYDGNGRVIDSTCKGPLSIRFDGPKLYIEASSVKCDISKKVYGRTTITCEKRDSNRGAYCYVDTYYEESGVRPYETPLRRIN